MIHIAGIPYITMEYKLQVMTKLVTSTLEETIRASA